ncbi:hypothetical protein [Nitrincola sp. MINF-07-Sa-05]|uniref:hypothetical protein n=1 Tax=Nitrincola salilacus TaxID=3400273 RepID=UPI0039182228
MSQEKPSLKYGPKQKPWEEQVPDVAKGLISAPSSDPVEAYLASNKAFPIESESVKTQWLEIPPAGISQEEKQFADEQVLQYATKQRNSFLGYQVEERISYETLAPYLDMCLNNIGDPFINGYYTVNSKCSERMVLDYFASLWNGVWPSIGPSINKSGRFQPGDPESYWGYVLSMGSTEGNLYGMLNARDYLSGRMLLEEEIEYTTDTGNTRTETSLYKFQPDASGDSPNAYTPVAFYSEDTHYSIIKAMEIEKIDTFGELGNRLYPEDNPLAPGQPWPAEVPSEAPTAMLPCGSGAVDVDKLLTLVEFFAARGYPILLCLNYGTTFKGAYDDIPEVCRRLKPILQKYGLWEREVKAEPVPVGQQPIIDIRTGYWIHVDGALGASYMPFVKMAARMQRYQDFFKSLDGYTGPDFDFRNPMIHSIVTSGHKWPGAPWPTGVYMTRHKYMVAPPDNPEYVGSPDTTFAGSRNGFSALILWDFIARTPYDTQITLAMHGQRMARYAHEQLLDVQEKIKATHAGYDIRVQHTPLAVSLIFQKPNAEIINRYSLCSETVKNADGTNWEYVHFFCMWDVGEELIDRMCNDLLKPGAFPYADDKPIRFVESKVTRALPLKGRRILKIPTKGRGFK